MKMAHFIPTNASIIPTRISGPGLRSAWSIKRPGRSLQPSHQENTYRLSHNHMPSLNPRTPSQNITRQSPIPRKSNLPPSSAHFLCPPSPKRLAIPAYIFISFAAKCPSHAPTRTRVYHNLRVSPEKAAGRVGPVDVIPAAPPTHPPLTKQGRMPDIYTNKREDDPRGAVFPTPMRKLLPAGGGADRSKISACSVCFAAWVERYFFFDSEFLILPAVGTSNVHQ
jgi:hypothetical protein